MEKVFYFIVFDTWSDSSVDDNQHIIHYNLDLLVSWTKYKINSTIMMFTSYLIVILFLFLLLLLNVSFQLKLLFNDLFIIQIIILAIKSNLHPWSVNFKLQPTVIVAWNIID